MGQAADVRDIIANLGKLRKDCGNLWNWCGLMAAGVGVIPGPGDAAKGAFKGLRKSLAEAGQQAVKRGGDEFAQGVGKALREGLQSADEGGGVVRRGVGEAAGGLDEGAGTARRAGVDPYDTGSYGDLRKRSTPGDGLDLDHQPSHASNVRRAEEELGRPLTRAEEKAIRNQGTAVARPAAGHRATSPTYGGRNTSAQIGSDAADPGAAVARDSDSMVVNAAQKHKDAARRAAEELRRQAKGQ